MKNILMLTTGGTIVSQPGKNGLEPNTNASSFLRFLEELSDFYHIDYRPILELDSSNIQGEEWKTIAGHIYHALNDYDGVVITHGTDTMAYTASMLSFMLQNLQKPVVLTGSQMPISEPLTDAKQNIYTALSAIDAGIPGVSIAFNHQIFRGCRAVKVRTMGFDAFQSVNVPCSAFVCADGMKVGQPLPPAAVGPTRLEDRICHDVFLLKLIPGTNPKIFDALLSLGYKGVVLEAFGAGGLHFIRRDLLKGIEALIRHGVSVVVCSQCLYERSDFSIYEVGQKLLATGVIQGGDMTTEAAVTKLMWALGQTQDPAEVRKIFATNYAGEITL